MDAVAPAVVRFDSAFTPIALCTPAHVSLLSRLIASVRTAELVTGAS